MKGKLFFLFLVLLIPASFVQAQVSLQSDAVIKEMICHKWVLNKLIDKDGIVVPNPEKVKLLMTFYKSGDLVISPMGELEKQKWVYDSNKKIIKVIEPKDQSVSGSFKIVKIEEKVLVLSLLDEGDTMYFSRVD